jgi:ankyrin repeat protein
MASNTQVVHAGRLIIELVRSRKDEAVGHVKRILDTIPKQSLQNLLGFTSEDSYGWTPMHIAASEDAGNVIRMLIEYGDDVNRQAPGGFSPIIMAAAANAAVSAMVLIDAGADLGHQESQYGRTPLGVASVCNALKVAQLFIAAGANKESRDHSGVTPLSLGIASTEIAQFLIAAGADVNTADSHGLTPLHYAILNNVEIDVVQSLLHAGASVNTTCSIQILNLAVRGSPGKLVEILLESGADPRAVDERGCTALHYASHDNRMDVVGMLLKYGADINKDCFTSTLYET